MFCECGREAGKKTVRMEGKGSQVGLELPDGCWKASKKRNLDVELDDFYRMSRVTGQGRHFLQLYYQLLPY